MPRFKARSHRVKLLTERRVATDVAIVDLVDCLASVANQGFVFSTRLPHSIGHQLAAGLHGVHPGDNGVQQSCILMHCSRHRHVELLVPGLQLDEVIKTVRQFFCAHHLTRTALILLHRDV